MARNSTIDKTAGDYSTISAWEASIDRGTNGDETGTITDGSTYDEQVSIDAAVSGTAKIILEVNAANRHTFKRNTGAKIAPSSGSGGVLAWTFNDYVTVDGLEIDGSAGLPGVEANITNRSVCRRLFVYDNALHGIYVRPGGTGEINTIDGCVALNSGHSGFYCQVTVDQGEIYLIHSLAIQCTTNGVRRRHDHAGALAYAYNTIALDNGTNNWQNEDGGTWDDGDHNGTGDGSAGDMPGTNPHTSLTTSIFEDYTSGSEDLHLAAAEDGNLEGHSTTSNFGPDWFADDADGDTRVDFDIGADEIAAAGATGHVLPQVIQA